MREDCSKMLIPSRLSTCPPSFTITRATVTALDPTIMPLQLLHRACMSIPPRDIFLHCYCTQSTSAKACIAFLRLQWNRPAKFDVPKLSPVHSKNNEAIKPHFQYATDICQLRQHLLCAQPLCGLKELLESRTHTWNCPRPRRDRGCGITGCDRC